MLISFNHFSQILNGIYNLVSNTFIFISFEHSSRQSLPLEAPRGRIFGASSSKVVPEFASEVVKMR